MIFDIESLLNVLFVYMYYTITNVKLNRFRKLFRPGNSQSASFVLLILVPSTTIESVFELKSDFLTLSFLRNKDAQQSVIFISKFFFQTIRLDLGST